MSALLLPIYILIFVGLIYFIGIRPQQRRKREQDQLLSALQVGDDVITVSGIYGRVSEIEAGDTVILEVAEDVDLRFSKSAVVRRLTGAEPAASPTQAEPVARRQADRTRQAETADAPAPERDPASS